MLLIQTFLNKSNLSWMYSDEVYDLLLPIAPSFSDVFVMTDWTHEGKKTEKQTCLLAMGTELIAN